MDVTHVDWCRQEEPSIYVYVANIWNRGSRVSTFAPTTLDKVVALEHETEFLGSFVILAVQGCVS